MLVVEDSTLITSALRILFEESGYDVTVAATVREAVDAATAHDVDVMLLDLTLPDGDGLSVLSAARERGAEPRVTAALTGRDDPSVVARCEQAGCRAVLVKPVSTGELLARVAGWVAPTADS